MKIEGKNRGGRRDDTCDHGFVQKLESKSVTKKKKWHTVVDTPVLRAPRIGAFGSESDRIGISPPRLCWKLFISHYKYR